MITVNALPTIFPITGGGVFCLGYGDWLGLSGSATGINYQLYFSGAPSGSVLAGTGSPIDMGWPSAYGDYLVTDTNSVTGCWDTMGYVNISISTAINPVLIPVVSVSTSAGDTVCAGTSVIFDALPVNGGTAPALSVGGKWCSCRIGWPHLYLCACQRRYSSCIADKQCNLCDSGYSG